MLSPELRGQVEQSVGPAHFALAHRWARNSSEVWRVSGPWGVYALKLYNGQGKYEQERKAYRDWLPRAENLSGMTPSLIAEFPEQPPALLLSWVTGQMFTEIHFASASDELFVFHAAGLLLARLHDIEVNITAARSHAAFVREKIVRRSHALRGELADSVLDWALRIANGPGWEQMRLGYCHRDFSPRNWLIDTRVQPFQVSLIDFEHSAVDFCAMDVMKLWDGPFIGHRDRRRAFYAGYGRTVEDDARSVALLAPAHGLAIVNWSLEFSRADYLAHGKEFLRRAAASHEWMWE